VEDEIEKKRAVRDSAFEQSPEREDKTDEQILNGI